MFDRRSEFFKLSKEIAKRFLQSAVIVDDQAYFGENLGLEPRPELIPPQKRSLRQDGPESGSTSADEETRASNSGNAAHRFDAKKVIDSFAQQGIVCSVLRPEEEEKETLTDMLHKLAACADIVVIDWVLQGDNGEKALEMLTRVAGSSTAQLRLIVVYTGDQDIMGISQEIKRVLEDIAEASVQEEDEGFTMIFGATRIAVLAKPETKLPDEHQHRLVPFDGLADRVTEEFTAMTASLISNVVLESLAQVRRNTHKILSQFSLDLDAPYLTHRALLVTPDEAEDLLTALVAEELQAILEETHVGNKAGADVIGAWIEARKDNGVDFTLTVEDGNDLITVITGDTVVALLRKGIEDTVKGMDCISKGKKKKILRDVHKLPLTSMFHADVASSECLDEKLAFVTSMRSYYENVPQLTMGTIVKEMANDEPSYWVCIQPRCDCVRIGSKRVFPFLPLKVTSDGNFDITLKEGDRYVRLLHKKKPYDLRMIKFEPLKRDNGVVTAKKDGEVYCFQDTSRHKYIWVGELRRETAQRLSNQFAATLSRVGLDESEWLRLWARRRQQN